MDDYVTRAEFNGVTKRIAEVRELKPKVERNESDIQKIFDEMAKIPSNNAAILKEVNTANGKTVTKVVITLLVAVILMFVKELVFK